MVSWYLPSLSFLVRWVWPSPWPSMLLQMALILFNDWIIFHCIYVPHLSIHSSLSGPLGCFQVLAAVGSATVNTEDTCPFKPCLSGWTPSSGMRTCGSSVPFHRQLRAALRGCASPTPALCSTPSPGFTVCGFWWWPYWLVWDGISL